MTQTVEVSQGTVQDFLIREAELLDDGRFEDWHALFTEDARYTIPLSDGEANRHASLVNDDALRLDERVYHLSQVPFPSQSPRSRTLHVIGNVRIRPRDDAEPAGAKSIHVVSNQIVFEMRLGDFRQVGLGEQRTFAARVEHELEIAEPFRIASKRLWLVNRGAPMSNLTFLL